MSYEIVKYISFNEEAQSISISACSNNISPKSYTPWNPLDGGHFGYDEWKRLFARSLFDGSAQFQSSSRCAAKRAFDATMSKLGGNWRKVYDRFPNCSRFDDPAFSDEYDKFEELWVDTYIDELGSRLRRGIRGNRTVVTERTVG